MLMELPSWFTLISREKSDRPLDCWKEVEAFKNEVSKLEQVSLLSIFGREVTRLTITGVCQIASIGLAISTEKI